MSAPEWTVVVQGDWHLPHFVNMLSAYRGNSEQRLCATEVIAQIESQMIPVEGDRTLKTTRPLVVIDPEDREQIERLLCGYAGWRGSDEIENYPRYVDDMQVALREFATPTPPKPEEPQGLGAVVEDAEGRRIIRVSTKVLNPWQVESTLSMWSWREVLAVRVLSEGVTP